MCAIAYFVGFLIGVVIAIIASIIASVISYRKGIEFRKRKAEAEIGSAEQEAERIISEAQKIAEAEIGSAEQEAERIISEAQKIAEAKKREVLLEAKEEIHKSRLELDRENKDRRNEIQRLERRLVQKEEALDRKVESLEQKEEVLNKKSKEIQELYDQTLETQKQQIAELERISGLSADEAKEVLLKNVESEVRHEMAILIKEIEAKAKEEADTRAKNIVAMAIQKCAADHVSEVTVSVVPLPNDEMKGRIIGREGRNIRTLETLTGIDLIIDDTPEAVILSGFDPIRREVARITLEKLILDGRIHPARIEEMVEKAKKEVENTIRQEGENATFDTGVHGLHPEIV